MTEPDTAPATDRDLLRAFAESRDEAAFAALVGRHGPVVYGACRRVLGNPHDADDAFQATFLVLARKPGGVGRPEQLGGWLYAVAVRCARRAKARATARQARQQPLTEVPAPAVDPDWSDVRPVLDEEIGALPDKLREALVACELQGLDRAAAAATLGVPEGTVSSRLARAKEALRGRLARRGLALTAVGVGIVLSKAAPAAVPPGLAAVAAAGGSAAAVGLANAEVSAMFWVKAAKIGLAAVVVAAAGVGGMVGYRQAAAAEDKKADKEKLQGDWKVVSIKTGGQDNPNKDQVGDKMTFKGDKMTLTPFEAEITLDPAKDPKYIDLKILDGPDDSKGKTCLGIYKLELDGDRLVIHSSHPDGERPTAFESNAGERSVLFVLERVKK